MSREEFLKGLQDALSGQVSPVVVQENLKYYDEYIRGECGKGRREAEVMEELGDPRLIARTIEDTTPGAGDGAFEAYGEGREAGDGRYQQAAGNGQYGRAYHTQNYGSFRYYDLTKWYWKLLTIVIVIAVIALVLAIVGGILSIVIPLLPVLIIAACVMWFLRGPHG